MKTRWLFPSLALVVGCGPLLSDPGSDFAVSVPGTSTSEENALLVFQQTGPMPITFQVDGCDDFSTTVQASGAPTIAIQDGDVKPLGNGRWVAMVDPDLLHATDDYCTYDTERPQEGYAQIAVTCREDGRVQNTTFRTKYATSWRASYRGRGPSDAVFRGETPAQFYDVGAGWLDIVSAGGVGTDVYAAVAPAGPPLLAATNGHVYLHAGCPINDCGFFWTVDTPELKVGSNASYLQTFDFSENRADFVRNVKVPGDAVDLAVDPDQSVVLLSPFTGATAITRVIGASATSIDLEGEANPTRFAMLGGKRVFLTRVGDTIARLRGTDGVLLGEIALPGSSVVSYLSIAPTGDAFIMFRGGEVWMTTMTLGAAGVVTTSTQLASDLTELISNTAEDSSFGAAWTDTGVAIRDRSHVEVYARTAPFAQIWKKEILQVGSLINTLGLGTSLVVQTQTGVQIYDQTGKLTGGADPLPEACRLDYSPRHVAVVGPDTIALSGKRAVYQFRATLP